MASAAKVNKPAGRDSGHDRDFGYGNSGQKRKRGAGGKDGNEDKDDGTVKTKEKRRCYNCKSTQHLTQSCPKICFWGDRSTLLVDHC